MMTCGNIMKAKDVKLQKIDKSTNISCYGENSWKKIKMSNNHQKSYSDHRWIKMSMNHWKSNPYQWRKDFEYEFGKKDFLEVTQTKGVLRFTKKKTFDKTHRPLWNYEKSGKCDLPTCLTFRVSRSSRCFSRLYA